MTLANKTDGTYEVKDGVVTPVRKMEPGKLAFRIVGWLFIIYFGLAIANCAVQEGIKIYTAVQTVA